MPRLISLDIGSTWTKAAVFVRDARGLRLEKHRRAPTTSAALGDGAAHVLRALLDATARTPVRELFDRLPVYWSSSARGGLRMAAIGLTPALTLEAARLAACGAGGRVVKAYAYTLTDEDIRELEALACDIVLLCGGTDGGHTRTVIDNARRLAGATLRATIVFAGNRHAADDVRSILRGRDLCVAANVMPEVGAFAPEAAQDAIRRAFLAGIVEGKGLGEVRALTGRDPLPTPAAVQDLVRALPEDDPRLRDIVVVDAGGATTDVYSRTQPASVEPCVVVRGIPAPPLMRTVEGDLGLRVSVRSLRESAAARIARELAAGGLDPAALDAYVERVADTPPVLPAPGREEALEGVLARACIGEALARHAGRRRACATPSGRVWVQQGKDLRGVRLLVVTGGCAAALDARRLSALLCTPPCDPDQEVLMPSACEVRRDTLYVWPLLGNLAAEHPQEAAACAVSALERAGDADAH